MYIFFFCQITNVNVVAWKWGWFYVTSAVALGDS